MITDPKFNKRFNSKGEIELRKHFQDKFPNDEWTYGGVLRLKNGMGIVRDLYSNKLKICIEYDGIWHFKDIHGQLKDKQEKDLSLENWCLENNYKLIRIKESVYLSNKQYWLEQIEIAINGIEQIVKFY